MRLVGRLLQICGLIILPVAMFLEMSDGLGRAIGLSQMVIMLVFGIASFYLGWILEGYARQQ